MSWQAATQLIKHSLLGTDGYVVRHNISETSYHCFLALTWTDLDLPSTGP